MNVKIPKDIDATEAKVFAGLSLKKAGFAMIALAVVIFLSFTVKLPPLFAGVPGGIIMFLGTYKKYGMSALTISIRVLQNFLSKQEYFAEPIASTVVKSQKECEKAAKEWNKELGRLRKRHPNTEIPKTVRCTKSRVSRK